MLIYQNYFFDYYYDNAFILAFYFTLILKSLLLIPGGSHLLFIEILR